MSDRNIDDILAGLSPATRKRILSSEDASVERLPSPSVGLNAALNGGFGAGRQILIYGNKSSGKSSFCLQLIADAQRKGKVCALIDAEKAYDPEWAERMGVDIESLILSRLKRIESVTSLVVELMQAGVDLIVVDSISSMLGSAYFDKSGELKELNDTNQIGNDAKDMASAVKMMNYANDETTLVLVSQIRFKITSYGAAHTPTGGEAVKFYSSTVIKFSASPREDDQIKAELQFGDKLLQRPVGRKVNWLIEFNKVGPPNATGSYDFFYDGENVGIDAVGEVVDLAIRNGIIASKAKSAWLELGDQKFQGRRAMIDHMKANPDVLETVRKQIVGV